jgi:hypothetical protein
LKDNIDVPAPTTSDDDMNLLDNDEAPLIKDGSPPPTGMDINTVFTLPAEFGGIEEEVAQVFLDPNEAMFENPEESSQHLKPLYIQGHISGGATINMMSYIIFKKHGRDNDELMKTNLKLNGVGSNPMEAQGVVSMELTVGSKSLATAFFVIEVQGNIALLVVVIGFTPTTAFLLYCINS